MFASMTAVVAGMLALVAASVLTADQVQIAIPLLATVSLFVLFWFVLRTRTGVNVFGELGFVYLALACAYTVVPGVSFLVELSNSYAMLDSPIPSTVMPDAPELGVHLWRHALFVFAVAAGYLAFRGKTIPLGPLETDDRSGSGRVVAILIAVIVSGILAVSWLSAPVEVYYEHYTRFDHLSWPLLRFTYVCLILKSGGYFVAIALMFREYRRFWPAILFTVVIICAYEGIYSLGSRIEIFKILLACACCWHYEVAEVSLKRGALYLLALVALFSGIEVYRHAGFSTEAAQDVIADRGSVVASEFNSVYFTGFHLYAERAEGSLPPRDPRMFFYDVLSVIPFVDFTAYHPQYWYARHYFPAEVVPPRTVGVIADSAIWGGEFDLLIRGYLNGMIFALITKWFLRRRQKWWALAVYAYCYATSVMVLKYSIGHQLSPLIKVLLPALLLTGLLFRMFRSGPTSSVARVDAPAPSVGHPSSERA